MTVNASYLKHVMELLEPIGDVTSRAMFGGHGIFHQGNMFALISDDTLYFKADEKNRPDYEARGLGPFSYERKGKQLSMSYYRAPYEALDNPKELCQWAQKAYDAAVRGARNKGKRKQSKNQIVPIHKSICGGKSDKAAGGD